MAKTTVSIYGSYRTEYVLTRRGTRRFCRLVAILLLGTALHGCSNDSAISEASPAAGSAEVSRQLIELLGNNANQFNPPGEPRLPADMNAHLQTQFESFSLEALLFTDKQGLRMGSVPAAALISQIDRFALQPQTAADEVESQWRYDGIMRSSVFIDAVVPDRELVKSADVTVPASIKALASLERVETVQRMALDLAGATSKSLWVGGDRMSIAVKTTDQASCERSYRWESMMSAQQQIALDFTVDECPSILTLGELNTWAESAIAITGMLTSQAPMSEPVQTVVSGTAWFRQSWGNVPVAAGAVVIDSLALSLDDNRILEVSRSKRRSGRGPQTVSATLHTQGQTSVAMNVAWEDSTEQQSGASGRSYPAQLRLRSDDGTLDLTAAIMNRVSESGMGSDVRAHVPVVVSGTYTGSGFLSFTALAAGQGDRGGSE